MQNSNCNLFIDCSAITFINIAYSLFADSFQIAIIRLNDNCKLKLRYPLMVVICRSGDLLCNRYCWFSPARKPIADAKASVRVRQQCVYWRPIAKKFKHTDATNRHFTADNRLPVDG